MWAGGPEFDQARKLYNLTEFEQSLKILRAIPQKDGAVYELIGRNYYMQGDFKKATEALEKAVAAEPGNSEFNLWLGRAYGRRAETSSLFTAPGYASKARQYFEKAAQLNPRNLEAQSDLFEYYLEAPGFLGGGLEKAAATAEQIARINPAEGHWAQAKLAEQRKEFSSAEEQLRRAIESDAAPGGAVGRPGAAAGQTGAISGGRPELRARRSDCAQQSKGAICQGRRIHQSRPKSESCTGFAQALLEPRSHARRSAAVAG